MDKVINRYRKSMLAQLELSEEEKMYRRTRIGSSELGALLGLNKKSWKRTAADIVRRLIDPESVPEFQMNESMIDGKLLEPFLIQKFELATGYTVRPAPPKLVNEHLADNADGLVYDGDKFIGVYEAKTTKLISDWKHGVPIYYQPQCQLHMMAWGTDKCFVIGWRQVGESPKIYELPANPEMQEVILAKAEELFEKYVKTGTYPPVDVSDAWRDKLDSVPCNEGERLEATEELDAMVSEFRRLQHELKDLEADFEIKKRQLQMALGSASTLTGQNYEISYKEQRPRRTVDYKGLLAELNPPQKLIEQFTKTAAKGIRPLRARFFTN
mgnify:CR=1 FL=1|tara:strand:+ start:561 stop:1541 length:981 start_codon:yes stop_codon:yes gene_type:complete